jgi:hypothetical protein
MDKKTDFLNTAKAILFPAEKSPKDDGTAAGLCSLGIFGIAGLHRFYVGRTLTGLLYLFTCGLFFVGTVIDLVLILSGRFRDGNRRLLSSKVVFLPPTYRR